MEPVQMAWLEWRWFAGVVARGVVLLLALCVSPWAGAQASSVGLNMIVCGPENVPGVTYVSIDGFSMGGSDVVVCGTDASGNELALQVDTALVAVSPQASDGSGAVVGAEIGAAVLGVMAIAYCFRLLRNFVNSSSEG